jgi:hypothetical protein
MLFDWPFRDWLYVEGNNCAFIKFYRIGPACEESFHHLIQLVRWVDLLRKSLRLWNNSIHEVKLVKYFVLQFLYREFAFSDRFLYSRTLITNSMGLSIFVRYNSDIVKTKKVYDLIWFDMLGDNKHILFVIAVNSL